MACAVRRIALASEEHSSAIRPTPANTGWEGATPTSAPPKGTYLKRSGTKVALVVDPVFGPEEAALASHSRNPPGKRVQEFLPTVRVMCRTCRWPQLRMSVT